MEPKGEEVFILNKVIKINIGLPNKKRRIST